MLHSIFQVTSISRHKGSMVVFLVTFDAKQKYTCCVVINLSVMLCDPHCLSTVCSFCDNQQTLLREKFLLQQLQSSRLELTIITPQLGMLGDFGIQVCGGFEN